MKKLNTYINEAWDGVKKQSIKADIEAWCEEMGIENYTINSKGEIDVDDSVILNNKDFKELPYKFGWVSGNFSIENNNMLISLKNCPSEVGGYFSCNRCNKLNSLNGCPKEVGLYFYCRDCKRKFAYEEVMSLCKVSRIKLDRSNVSNYIFN